MCSTNNDVRAQSQRSSQTHAHARYTASSYKVARQASSAHVARTFIVSMRGLLHVRLSYTFISMATAHVNKDPAVSNVDPLRLSYIRVLKPA